MRSRGPSNSQKKTPWYVPSARAPSRSGISTCGDDASDELPFYFDSGFERFVDAVFESVSGFTTTGASILTNIEAVSKGILFWRSFIQWLGGMGIIVLSVAILPFLGVGGM